MALAAVRSATSSDVPEIVRIQRQVWHSAYREVLPPSALSAIDAPETERVWADTVEDAAAIVLIATEGGNAVGFCAAGRSDEEGGGLISTLLVEPRWGRRGHGGRLLASAAEALRATGVSTGVTWVLMDDPVSMSFFKSVGWEPDGQVRGLDVGDGRLLREMRVTGSLEMALTGGERS